MFEESAKIRTFLKVSLFGDGGSGKTKFLLSFPGVAVIDTERGTDPYRGKYTFKVKHANRWKDLAPILDWLEQKPAGIQTFAIDSLTIFYQDLVNDMVEYVRNKRGHEILSQAEWTVIKRRWASFLNRLVDLPLHIVLSMRERDEYEETTNSKGEEVRKKTGNQLMDADKQTKYLFDVSLRCFTEEDKKAKNSKFLVRVDKTRYDWMPKYAVYDVTGKPAFETLFTPHLSCLGESAPIIRREVQPEAKAAPPEAPGSAIGTPPSTAENVGDILRTFAGPSVDPSQLTASGEDIKVLMTRCGQMTWPGGEAFKSTDGKALIKALFKIEKSKDLRKAQVDWLYEQFGKVLAGQAHLVRDEKEIPYIREGALAAVAAAVQ